ncbi:MAG TPA: hypothetical protein ENI84_02140 [Thiothrix sp.]|nr:hypothetical protein [Thiothrix sp.]
MSSNNKNSIAIALFSLFLAPPLLVQPLLAAENNCVPWQEKDSKLSNLRIGKITIETMDVFDPSNPKESTFLHRTANKIHIETQDSVISNQLLFSTGDAFLLRKIHETARLLQANRYIKDATVIPVERCGNLVNIAVTTRDVWTLTPGVSFGRTGGKSKSGFEIQEHNLLGYGKSLSLSYEKGTERNSTLLTYGDPQLFGSRKRFFITLQNNSDGKGYNASLDLPFYSFDSTRSWGVSSSSITQQSSIYDKGVVVDKFDEEKQDYSLFYGWSKGRKEDHVSRFKVGWQYINKTYPLSLSTPLLDNSIESYPWLEYAYIQDKYTKKTNFRTMDILEDVSLGLNLSARLGFLHEQFGSDDNQLKLTTRFAKGYELGERDLGFLTLDTNSYLGDGLLKGEQVSLKGDWYSFNEKGNDVYLSASITEKSNLLPNEQITLGGDNGLRGYPSSYQTGNKAALITAEKRFHFDWYPLHLAKFGAVAFADVGTAWGAGNDAKVLADVGIGLRMVPTRSSSAKTLHLDIAFPLIERDSVDSVQVLIKTRNSF